MIGERIHVPAPRPCGSCPYRQDVPSGVWEREEYEKLPAFDEPTPYQPPAVFLCHQRDDRMCAGWVGCHDMVESLGLRIASAAGLISLWDLTLVMGYTTDVPLFGSGREAAEHGLRDVETPGPHARHVSGGLLRAKRGHR